MDQHLTLGNLNRIIDLANRYTEFVETSVVGQKKVVQYTQVAKSLIAESFDITSIVVAAEYRKVHGRVATGIGRRLVRYAGRSGPKTGGAKTCGRGAKTRRRSVGTGTGRGSGRNA
jgi:hypothetical protein